MGMEKAGVAQLGHVHLGSFAVVPRTPAFVSHGKSRAACPL